MGQAPGPRCGVREVGLVADGEVLYNFGVLTKRYELVSRTASQLAPGIAGLAVGFVMLLTGVPVPLPFVPVLVGFWFAIGKIPFGQHRGTRVRSVVGPLARHGILRLGGKTRWEMPTTWLAVAVDPASSRTVDRARVEVAVPVGGLGAADENRRDREGNAGAAAGSRACASSCPRSWAGCGGRR